MPPEARKTQGSVDLTREEFERRAAERFADPAFDTIRPQVRAVLAKQWEIYDRSHKSARSRKAGPGFQDPSQELDADWLEARERLIAAERRQKDPSSPSRVLLICGSPRTDQTCPGEMSKSHRLCQFARAALEGAGMEVDYLDLSRLTAEFGRVIHPCKGCVSTAMPLCHWPCSCYPNHALGQVDDWMNEIYGKWVSAHGIMIVTPVHWYQVPGTLKLMIDRLVCADGGNADPTTTSGKDPGKAKALELEGWDFPRHLSGRLFSVIVHGDAAGVDNVQAALVNWLQDMGLHQASHASNIARYIGYYGPYATSHDELDRDHDLRREVENAATILSRSVGILREGRWPEPAGGIDCPRAK